MAHENGVITRGTGNIEELNLCPENCNGPLTNGALDADEKNLWSENGVLSSDDIDVNEKDVCSEKLPPELWTPTKNCENNEELQIKLPPEQWSPKKTPRPIQAESQPSPRKHAEKKKLSYEEIIQQLEEKVKVLLQRKDFTRPEARADLKFIQRQTRYSPDVILNRRIVDHIVKLGIAHLFLSVWRSVSEIDFLSPEHAPAFRNLQTALSIIWNCTDKSSTLCDCLVRCGVIQLFLEQLSGDVLTGSPLTDDDNELYLVKAYLGMLHNIVRLCSDSRKLFRTANGVSALRFYFKSDNGLVKTKSYLILSYIINETENDVINATDENIEFMVGILREALQSENHFSKTYAFWGSEIVCGLNHLAVNDSNKVRICHHGALELYFQLLRGDNLEEQNLSVAGLWILVFNDENKYLIRGNTEYMDVLKNLANDSPHESIRRSARGALWVIRSAPARQPQAAPSHTESTDVPHVMMSYHWADQSTLLKVRSRLIAAGFKVWMDVDNMSGSTLEAMALAVERAAIVLIALSQGYKDSASCRTEAEYTYQQRKDIIPLLLQSGYVPDGWLGMLVGTRLYFDLSSDKHVDANINKLIKELGNRGRYSRRSSNASSVTSSSTSLGLSETSSATASGVTSPQVLLDVPERSQQISECESLSSSLSSTSSLHSYVRIPAAKTWTQQHVRHWLASHQLASITERMEAFNGDLLLQYKRMMESAPEYFYNSLERHLKLDLITALQFSKALESIS